MSREDSEALFRKTAYGDTISSDRIKGEDQQIRQMVETLGCLALTIVQAGAYVRETSCTLNDYLALYQRRQKEVLGYLPRHGEEEEGVEDRKRGQRGR